MSDGKHTQGPWGSEDTRYENIDRIYADHPEVKDLIRAAAIAVRAHGRTYNIDGVLNGAMSDLRAAGARMDNRDWLK